MKNSIDFVVMWVDGNDPVWRAEKEKYSNNPKKNKNSDLSEVRYRDWENLEIWVQNALKFAPWVHNIFVITANQKPDFLDKYEKVVHVNHSDYIPYEYLPTFNSHTIELNIHRIENLSEQFVLFNDDMFLIDQVTPEDFFVNGKPKDVYASNVVAGIGLTETIQNITLNDVSLINKYFSKRKGFKKNLSKWLSFKNGPYILRTLILMPWSFYTGFYEPHVANSYLKSTFETVWEKEKDKLVETCNHRFRHIGDVNQWLMRYWQLAEGLAVNRTYKFGKMFAVSDESEAKCIEWILKQKSCIVCINDLDSISDFEKTKRNINKALTEIR